MPPRDVAPHRNTPDSPEATFHQLPWSDFDELARGEIRPAVVHRLRHAERSRRLLLLRALMDEVSKTPELFAPLPSPEDAWELLARVETRSPDVFELVLAHPYLGSWAGYTIRLLRKGITGVCPMWSHVGHVHAVAAAAAIRARLNFHAIVPVWEGGVILPTLGMAHLPADEPHSVAEVRGTQGRAEITNDLGLVVLTEPFDADRPNWWAVRDATATAGRHRLTTRLDDIDPYRGLHEPMRPRRMDPAELRAWRAELTGAWRLIAQHFPERAEAFSAGLDSVVPGPAAPFRSASASTGEAFGSALIARPDDAPTLAATLVHEFQHIVLGGVLHLAQLHEDDPRERFYVPWRPDPRPIGKTLQGIYAFFGIAAFWREIARAHDGKLARRAMFEFAQSRGDTWRVLDSVHRDASLTTTGRRFVDGIAERLRPWLAEPVPDDLRRRAEAITADHHAGYRMRHLRPDHRSVVILAEAWLADQLHPPPAFAYVDPPPTPVPDGSSSEARTHLIHLDIALADRRELASMWRSAEDVTTSDLAYATGRFDDAVRGYRAELAQHPDRVSSWIGLGLALAGVGTSPAARALTHYPELVRAVWRRITTVSPDVPTPERLATWLGQSVY
ncbi:HEXXH motif domain-containing protein [Actinophytocola algeriensis]|uniref:HEXXH motif-containing protein n=1 Tax=Actinophytocola algeriensis TaxID=1768010 RepID=A0A7W7VBN4_9PSEU|nr:HEXXH motif domain-containing protein [Actinophytocola algeriensis]MBB4904167.1 HEXXH motif-containing protein [Actinophytocola algeriensis]MBE1476976.1 HEXXH motif-containing protein [Actinophytocola algeriensis]